MQEIGFGFGGLGLLIGLIGGGFGLLVGAVAVVYAFKAMTGNTSAQKKHAALIANGRSGTAAIQQVGMGNMVVTIGVVRHVRMNLVLQVQLDADPSGHYREATAPYMVNMQVLIPEIAMPKIQPGETVPVRVDWNDPNTIAIDFGAMGYMV